MRSTRPPNLPDASPPPDDDASALGIDDARALPRTDPPRDALLGDALRRLDAVPPADVERVRRAIVTAAGARLSALRTPTWWEWTASWASAAIPLALAAGIGALVFALRTGSATTQPSNETTVATTTTYSPALLSVVGQAGSSTQVTDAVVGPASHDWLVAQVVQP